MIIVKILCEFALVMISISRGDGRDGHDLNQLCSWS